jgi:hypothetical protein
MKIIAAIYSFRLLENTEDLRKAQAVKRHNLRLRLSAIDTKTALRFPRQAEYMTN